MCLRDRPERGDGAERGGDQGGEDGDDQAVADRVIHDLLEKNSLYQRSE
jgi:hypothetical protein